MIVNPWYIPGSLQNVRAGSGEITGFQFIYREMSYPMVLLYVIHKMIVFVDGSEITQANLRLTRKGVTVRAADLPMTDWACMPGELVQFSIDYPGGLSAGQHTIRIDAIFGGAVGGGIRSGSKPLQIIGFQTEVK